LGIKNWRFSLKALDREAYIPVVESCIIGLVAGLSAVLLSAGVSWLGAIRMRLSDIWTSHYVLPAFGLIGGLVAGMLVERVAPEASGSGIPQVRARLDRVVMALDFRIALVKLLGGTFALGAGFFMGREGPTVQLGAAMAAPLTRWLPTTAEHKRQLIAAGAGAGLTAAFNAPLAGVTFVLEELLKEIKPSTMIITIVACSASCLVVTIFNPLHLRAAVRAIDPIISFVPSDVPFYMLLGVVAGLLGAVFNSGVLGALNLNRELLRVPVTIRIGLAGLVSGTIIAILPEVFRNYAGMRTLIVTGHLTWTMALMAFVEFYLLTLIAYGSGAPGGLFAPSLVLGAALGYIIGILERFMTGTGSTAAFALVGMGAFFSAVARTPLTAIVITFEMTTSFVLVTPLMFACVISSTVGDLVFKGGLYSHLMRWNGIHLRGPGSSDSLRTLKARDVMQTKVDTFSSMSLVKDVLPIVSGSAQRGFAVVDRGRLVGVVTQTDLGKVIEAKPQTETRVGDIMTPHPVAVGLYDSLEDILFLFSRYKFTWLPVVYHDKLVGIILQSDVLKGLFTEEGKAASAGQVPGDGDGRQVPQLGRDSYPHPDNLL
jgi:chloride channel protein, CIC family